MITKLKLIADPQVAKAKIKAIIATDGAGLALSTFRHELTNYDTLVRGADIRLEFALKHETSKMAVALLTGEAERNALVRVVNELLGDFLDTHGERLGLRRAA